ncbi:ribonuclease H-like domain-containing protein [Tanacetum coccineum]
MSDPTLYRSLAGALQYLTFTRPDISYAMQQVCLYMHDPRESHFSALKRILRYIRGTMPYGLQLFSPTTSSLVAYSDADWAGCLTTRRSTSGYCVFLGNNLLSWSSKRQVTLSRSSAEAEYRGVANAVAETCWLRNLLRELHTPLSTTTLVYCDNVSAVYLSSNPVQHQRTKHIEIDIHFVRDLVAAGHIRVLHVSSRYQYTDIFTKGLPTVLFDEFRSSLSVRSSPAQTAGGSAIESGFIAKSMGFRNTAGPDMGQAVTLHLQSDKSAFFDVHIDGYQDTLYTHTHRQFYSTSVISGTVDFIFGDAAVIFQNCLIICKLLNDGQSITVTAQGGKLATETTGIVIQNSRIVAVPVWFQVKSYLGRLWRKYSRTIIMESVLDDLIQPDGWMPWQGTFALDTLFYGEYANSGPGVVTDMRVKWKGFKVITDVNEAMQYTAGVFVQGKEWLKETGAPFYLGLKG